MSTREFKIYFSDFFGIDPTTISDYGAFNISLIGDLPLFVDPFLLFNSENPEYQSLHRSMVDYVVFLRDKSADSLSEGLIKAWYHFTEVKQNWMGFSKAGNNGRGLGKKFAGSLKSNLSTIFRDFGKETGAGTHLEKLTLIKNGVGKDQISDFVCNLIVGFLADYTEKFATQHIHPRMLQKFSVPKVSFNWKTQSWAAKTYTLPKFGKDYVLLTPIDILTKDEAWITQRRMSEDFSAVLGCVPNSQLRSQIDNYLASELPAHEATKKDWEAAVEKVVIKFPEVLDAFIRLRESEGRGASIQSGEKIKAANQLFVDQIKKLVHLLDEKSNFYDTGWGSYKEGMQRVQFLRHVIEKQDGYRLFYIGGKPIKREQDLQIMFKLTWFASDFDMNAEVNNGRGPSDFIVSYGSADKTVIEFKLASNTQLEKNLLKQAEIYSDAARAMQSPIKAILFFSLAENEKINSLLKKHKLDKCTDIVLIDASGDKPSASKA